MADRGAGQSIHEGPYSLCLYRTAWVSLTRGDDVLLRLRGLASDTTKSVLTRTRYDLRKDMFFADIPFKRVRWGPTGGKIRYRFDDKNIGGRIRDHEQPQQ